MNIKELKSKKLYKEYALAIPYNEVDELINNKIIEIIPTVSLPGFRKGKAPISIVKKKYEDNILSEVLQSIVQNNIKKLLEDKKFKVLRQPKVEIKKYEKEKPVEVEIKIDLEPEIKLEDFKKFSLQKYEIDLDKKTLDENYNNFLKTQKKYSKITKDRSIKNSDKVTINLSSDDKKVPDFLKSQKNIPIITDSDYQVLPDISKKLIEQKVKIGDKIKLVFDLKKLLKTKDKTDVSFNVEILSIEESAEFKVDDEFLKKIGLKTENELKENLKKNIQSQYDQALKQIEKKELMDILDQKHNFDMPEGILDEEFNSIWHRLEHAKKDNTLDDDDSSEESSEIEPTEWMKKCGHNCQMWQTKRCCACSDTRPLKQLYGD